MDDAIFAASSGVPDHELPALLLTLAKAAADARYAIGDAWATARAIKGAP